MSTVTEMLDKMDVVILPVMNVDGYYYSRKQLCKKVLYFILR